MPRFLHTLFGVFLACSWVPVGAQMDLTPSRAEAREGRVVVYGNTDFRLTQRLIRDFEARHPGVRVEYHEMNSVELHHRVIAEAGSEEGPDVAWSSAMDLQVKLVNDGYAQFHRSVETMLLPSWANWKNEAFGTTLEPIAIIYNRRRLDPAEVPQTHAAFAALLRSDPDRFRGRVATYDPRRAGLGYLLHTQDMQANPGMFWELARALGAAEVRTHAHTAPMLEQITSGAVLIGYNMLGSYSLMRASTDPSAGVVLPRDYTLVASRVAFITRTAPHPNAARLWIDYLLSQAGQARLVEHEGVYSVRDDVPGDRVVPNLREQLGDAFRPITIGPGLLANLDQARRRDFLRQWDAALAKE